MELGSLMKLFGEGEGGGKEDTTEMGLDHLFDADIGRGEDAVEGYSVGVMLLLTVVVVVSVSSMLSNGASRNESDIPVSRTDSGMVNAAADAVDGRVGNEMG